MLATARVRTEPRTTERKDRWWIEPALTVFGLTVFIIYSFIAATANANYYADPYLSPFYSPCLTANCVHPLIPIIGAWWTISPAILVVGSPLLFRLTCYYFRRAYYRGFFTSPAACAVPDSRRRYTGETRFPFILQNIHRYGLYLAVIWVIVTWWDLPNAFQFPVAGSHDARQFGIGLGTLIMLAEAVLITGYTFGCHAARHLVGGHLDSFHRASFRLRLWSLTTRLNFHHARWAWISLITVGGTDLYIRLLAMKVITDLRFI